ncbi:unnamed protein product [Boreogadus saida]
MDLGCVCVCVCVCGGGGSNKQPCIHTLLSLKCGSSSELLAPHRAGAGHWINGSVPAERRPIELEGAVITPPAVSSTHKETDVIDTLVTGADVRSQQHAIVNIIVIVNSYQTHKH